ncbi:MAG: glycerol-3-phosphate dehydrogenase/oxidase [Thermoanaerobaculia bacterium]|nr:glycerol-3-phosphate dehydrogenase/oxidase [Thermoanaerobaculia bacterium]
MKTRAERIALLESTPFHVLVVGGGITGAAAARDAASRGLRVALLDRGDWASGTSWRSSKLIHGGLRYLASGQVHLVFESLAERNRLARLAPHLVQPAEFLFAAYRDRGVSPLLLRLGLSLYDALALGRSVPHRTASRKALLARERLLENPDLLSGALYTDARTDDARLTLENVLDAGALGAVTVSRVAVTGFQKDRSGRIHSVTARDEETGRDFSVSALSVVNATGPWSDRLRGEDQPGTPPQLRLSRGAHVTVAAARLPLRQPVVSPSPDGRLLFAIPFGSVTLLGTTDQDFTGSPDDVAADGSDVRFLLKAANGLFPSASLTTADVVATFAALRPLQRESGKSVQDTSREDSVAVSPSGLVTVSGGKLTTHRRMGERAIDSAAEELRRGGLAIPKSRTRKRPFPGAPEEPLPVFCSALEKEARGLALDAETANHLCTRYGGRARDVLKLAAEDTALSERLTPGLPDIAAEIVFALRAEDARSVSDLLIRRTHLFWQAADQGVAALPRVAALAARELHWDRPRKDAAVQEYLSEIARSRRYR